MHGDVAQITQTGEIYFTLKIYFTLTSVLWEGNPVAMPHKKIFLKLTKVILGAAWLSLRKAKVFAIPA